MPNLPIAHRISVEDFEGKIDSLYRLVIVASRRASQLSKPETRPLVSVTSKKTTVTALREVLAGKVTSRTDAEDEIPFEE
jgi:DNA-directed RNA polymerase subunit omega